MKKNLNKSIFVTKPSLPEKELYQKYLDSIWEKTWLTNNGPLVVELEKKLKEFLGVKHLFYVSNGTIALQIAIRALGLSKEIITTPFTYVATANSIIWENCKPVFVDIDKEDFCIDADKIEAAITDKTEAIMAVHVFGYPSNVEKIEEIAKRHNLKVIYDAAHSFGTKVNGTSVLNYGDISTLSFHATKLFHTVEGGAIITNDDELAEKIKLMRSFGQVKDDYLGLGINAKNSEFHAAMGLSNLPTVKEKIRMRGVIVKTYNALLQDLGLKLYSCPKNTKCNYAYYPVVFNTENELEEVLSELNENNIFPRRYFYPSLNTLEFINGEDCPVSESVSERVLCLPLYHDLELSNVERICSIIKKTIKRKISVSVGIPAYNESENIDYILRSIYKQKQENFSLDQIIIALDGSSDKTKSKIQKWMKVKNNIRLIVGDSRKGKAYRLNQIYEKNKSDYLLTLDADVILGKDNDIAEMVKVFINNPEATTVAGHQNPIKNKSFISKALYSNNLLWNEIRLHINNGDHIVNLFGSATMLKREFSKLVKYPEGLTCDEEFLYVMSKKYGKFLYAKNTDILFRVAASLKEIRLQGARFLHEREELVNYFGKDIVKLHDIPLYIKVIAIFRRLLKDPFFTSIALAINLYLRISPNINYLNAVGMWDMIESTKHGIDSV